MNFQHFFPHGILQKSVAVFRVNENAIRNGLWKLDTKFMGKLVEPSLYRTMIQLCCRIAYRTHRAKAGSCSMPFEIAQSATCNGLDSLRSASLSHELLTSFHSTQSCHPFVNFRMWVFDPFWKYMSARYIALSSFRWTRIPASNMRN